MYKMGTAGRERDAPPADNLCFHTTQGLPAGSVGPLPPTLDLS